LSSGDTDVGLETSDHLENLRGDSERQEQLPSWFVASCRLRVHRAQSP
jgi:hypothetical protein